jgi:DNA-binding PadR family transcriptional regulator
MHVPRQADLGELEQLVLLAALRLEDEAYAPRIAALLEQRADRELSRGTLYAALDRLESRGYLEWTVETPTADRGGNRRRRYRVTAAGAETLAAARRILLGLWDGVEHLLPGGET